MKIENYDAISLQNEGLPFPEIDGAFELTDEELLEIAGNAGVVAGAAKGAVIGAIGGVVNAGLNGTSPITGAFTGGVVGAVTGGLGALSQ